MRQKWISLGFLCALCMSFFSGCENKNVNYSIDSENGDTQTADDGKKSSLEQFADASVWTEQFETVIDKQGDMRTVDINARVLLPDTKQMSVAEVKEAEFTESYKEKIAKQIFGNGEIFYNDVAHLPKKELEEWYDYYVKGGFGEYDAHLDEKIAAYEKAIVSAGDTYTPVGDFTVNEYLGQIEGATYELTFTERDNLNDAYRPVPHRTKEISLVPKEVGQVCPKEFAGTEYISYNPQYPDELSYVEGNYCGLTEEEARQKAQDFIDLLGLEYSVCAYWEPLLWSGEFGSDITTVPGQDYRAVNGYTFYYDYGIDGVSVVETGDEESYGNLWTKKKESEGVQYSMKARIRLCVTDKGIIQMNAYNPIETADVSANVGLLPIEAVRDSMRDQLLNHVGKLRFAYTNEKEISFDRMELIYFRVRSKEYQNTYSYIPVWRLGEQLSGINPYMPFVDNPLLVNAIDGSWINLFEEM